MRRRLCFVLLHHQYFDVKLKNFSRNFVERNKQIRWIERLVSAHVHHMKIIHLYNHHKLVRRLIRQMADSMNFFSNEWLVDQQTMVRCSLDSVRYCIRFACDLVVVFRRKKKLFKNNLGFLLFVVLVRVYIYICNSVWFGLLFFSCSIEWYSLKIVNFHFVLLIKWDKESLFDVKRVEYSYLIINNLIF